MRVIPDGIHVGDTLGKRLAKQHTAAIFDKPMFVQQPVVGLISGFEPSHGAKWISEFAHASPHLAIFVYDAILGHPYRHPPANVVVFSADDEETRTILPIFFQALGIVCFPAISGTPISLVLEAMTYGTACVAMATYGLPAEVKGAGVSVASAWDNFGRFHVPMAQLSEQLITGCSPARRAPNVNELQKHCARGILGNTQRKNSSACLKSLVIRCRTGTLGQPIRCFPRCSAAGMTRARARRCLVRIGWARIDMNRWKPLWLNC